MVAQGISYFISVSHYFISAHCKRGYLQVLIEWFKDFTVVYFIHFESNIKKMLVDKGDPI